MANTAFKLLGQADALSVSPTLTTLYTCPAGKTAIIVVTVVRVDTTAWAGGEDVQLLHFDGSTNRNIGRVVDGATVTAFNGDITMPIILNAGHAIKATAIAGAIASPGCHIQVTGIEMDDDKTGQKLLFAGTPSLTDIDINGAGSLANYLTLYTVPADTQAVVSLIVTDGGADDISIAVDDTVNVRAVTRLNAAQADIWRTEASTPRHVAGAIPLYLDAADEIQAGEIGGTSTPPIFIFGEELAV